MTVRNKPHRGHRRIDKAGKEWGLALKHGKGSTFITIHSMYKAVNSYGSCHFFYIFKSFIIGFSQVIP